MPSAARRGKFALFWNAYLLTRHTSAFIVKDLSRWGRNYVEVIEYLEQIFPFLGVRFISINDGYDSEDYKGRTAPLDVAFGTIMHDVYCKELSQKVRQSYVAKAQKGEFLCGVAPYGFEKSTTEKNKLVFDEESAAVVRRIFELACNGNSTTEIATVLNGEGVDTPLMYRKRKERVLWGAHAAVGEVNLWQDKNVRTILRDERYMGMQVSGKTRKPNPGSRNTASRGSGGKDAALLEIKRLTAHTACLERQSVSLYEDFADGKLDRDAYLAEKSACALELAHAKSRLKELSAILTIEDANSAVPHDEPILQRVLAATDVMNESLALIDRIVVYDPEHIEIRFAFVDSNVL